MGGYLFQNLISFTEEIVTYIKGGWVSNTDVIILYIHNLLLILAYILFHGKKGVNITMLQMIEQAQNMYVLPTCQILC